MPGLLSAICAMALRERLIELGLKLFLRRAYLISAHSAWIGRMISSVVASSALEKKPGRGRRQ